MNELTRHTERLPKATLADMARRAKPGDKWRQRKSGRIAIVTTHGTDQWGCIGLKHANNRTTHKWLSYFVAEFDPVTDEEKSHEKA
jgi:hypothetical protein